MELHSSGSALLGGALAAARAAGVRRFRLSLDGPPALHRRLRPRADGADSSRDTLSALDALTAAGLPIRVVTAVSAANVERLGWIYETLKGRGRLRWQVQIATHQGRLREHPGLIPPGDVAEAIVAILLRAAREGVVEAPMHCSVGYLVPEEAALRYRGAPRARIWAGHRAGLGGLAIASDGRVRGCPCLPEGFAVAGVRQRPLAAIWADDACFPYARRWTPDLLAGHCADCALASVCRAGCPGVSYGATGSIGLNPYCLRWRRKA